MNMHERVFVVNSEGETTEDRFTPIKDQYKKIREKYKLGGTFATDMLEKMKGESVDKDGDPFIYDFLMNLDDESLNKLSTEIPEDDMLQRELTNRHNKS